MSVYDAIDITPPFFDPDTASFPNPYGLNANNQTAGNTTTDGDFYLAYVERKPGDQPVATMPQQAAFASLKAINDQGIAVGTWSDGNRSHPFLVDPQNNAVDLRESVVALRGWAADVNNHGIIVGGIRTGDEDDSPSRGFLLDGSSGDVQFFDGFPDFPLCSPSAINNAGDVVGTCFKTDFSDYRPFKFSQGQLAKLFDQKAYAVDVNDQGHVCGVFDSLIVTGGNAGPFLFVDGQINMIPVNGRPYALNNHDQVVGTAMADLTSFAFIYDQGVAYDLNRLTPSSPIQMVNAYDINDAGAIATSGLDSESHGHALLLTPSPVFRINPQSILALVGTILFGVTEDGGGLIYFGRKPVPIDPWGWLSDPQIDRAFQMATSIIQKQFRGDVIVMQQALDQLQAFKVTVTEARKKKPEAGSNICLRLNVVSADETPFRGTVDIECKHQTLSDRRQLRNVDASQTIAIRGLMRAPQGLYEVTVTPTAVFKPVSQFVNVPPSGFTTIEFKIPNELK